MRNEMLSTPKKYSKSLTSMHILLQTIDEFANRLIDSNHYASDEVQERRDGIMQRRQAIEELFHARRQKLEESRKLQQFERDADEVKAWINEKLKIACDESYKVRQEFWASTVLSLKMTITCLLLFKSVFIQSLLVLRSKHF